MIYIPAIIGFSILFSLGAAEKMSDSVSLIVAAACFLMSIILLIFKKFRKTPVYSLVLLSMAFGIFYFSFYSQSISSNALSNGVYIVEGEISQFPSENNGKFYYVLENVKIDNKAVSGNARISSENKIEAKMHDKIKASCFIYKNKNSDYYLSKGIRVLGSINDLENIEIIKGENKSLKYYTEYLRSNIKNALTKYIPGSEAAFLCGILTGDKSALSDFVYIDFKKLGLAHWLAVSGLHLSILAGFLNSLLKRTNRRIRIISVCAVLIIFAAITGFPRSVVRSLVMNILVLLGELLYRKAESVNSLGIAVFLICLHSPFAIYDIGFLLSVFSTLGILLFADKINAYLSIKIKVPEKKILRKIRRAIFTSFSCSVCATVFVLPFSIYYFGTVSAAGILTNLIFTLPFTLLFILSGVISIVYYIPFAEFVLRGISFIAAVITRLCLFLVSKIAEIPYISISVYSVHFEIWFIISLLLLFLAVVIYKKKVFIAMAAVSLVAFIAAFSLNQVSLNKSVQIAVADGGNELSVIVSDKENVLLIGTDNVYLIDSVAAMNISDIDSAMILNSKQEDYYGALLFRDEFNLKNLYFKEEYINGFAEKEANKIKANDKTFESEKFSAKFIETESGSYVTLNAFNKSFLICSDDVKLSEISGYYDYVITSKDSGSIENFKTDTVIISSYEDNYLKIAKRFDDIANKYIATIGKGDIIININEDKEIIRRGYNG